MNPDAASRALRRASQILTKQHHAPFRIPQIQQAAQRSLNSSQRAPITSKIRIQSQARHQSTQAAQQSRPLTDRETAPTTSSPESQEAAEIAARKAQQPSYQLTFTCKKCDHRSSHHVTKQAYHQGTTLISCPGCKNRHLISDHLKIFSDTGVTLEDIMKEKGQLLKKGRLGQDGDIEFYQEDGQAETESVDAVPKALPG